MTKILLIVVALVVSLVAVVMVNQAEARERARSVPILRFECSLYKNQRIDPILNTSGQSSHLHQFFANPKVDAKSTGWSLARERPVYTSCNKEWETGSFWAPTVYDGSGQLAVDRMVWYYRYRGRQEPIITPPTGLELIGNDAKGDVRWGCGEGEARLDNPPQNCPAGNRLRLDIAFPNCLKNPARSRKLQVTWQGGSNVSFADGPRSCPRHYIALPEEIVTVQYRNTNGIQSPVKVSAENGKKLSAARYAHADIMHGEQYENFNFAIERCLRDAPRRGVPPSGCVDRRPGPDVGR